MKSYVDISGDGGSQVVEQITAINEKIEAQLSSVRHIIAVGSGKGGVGKSTVTAQLAMALRRQGERVAILDADLNGPSISLLTGMQDAFVVPNAEGMPVPRTKDGIGVLSFGSLLADNEALSFPCVSEGSSHTWRATREFSMLSETLARTIWGETDFLLVDLPPGPERTAQFIEFFGPRISLVLVTIPSDLSRGVVARSVAAVEKVGGRMLGVVSNMDGYRVAETGEIKPMFAGERNPELGIPVLGTIPFDPELAASCDQGLSVDSFSKLGCAEAATTIIDALLRELGRSEGLQ